jgi:hypothetical protein
MLLAIDLHKNFVNVEGIAIALVLSLQPSSVQSQNLIHQRRIDSRLTAMTPSTGVMCWM